MNETFPEDDSVIVQQFRGRGQGTFRICLSTPISDLATCRVTFGENISVSVSDYTPRFSGKGNPAQKRGTLVTFVEAAIGTHRTLRNEDFDKALAPWGELLKPTSLQNHQGTTSPNGNRFCVIDPGDKVIIGRIRVFSHATHQNVTFNTRYRGQKWRCRRCQADHIGPSPDLQAFYASKDARAKEIINHKVLSDSTLRRVEQVGLRYDVLCMWAGVSAIWPFGKHASRIGR